MNFELDALISTVETMTKAQDNESALSLVNELIEKYPREVKVWSLRGYLHALKRDYERAVSDLSRAIDLSPPEPCLFYDRGRYRFLLGDNALAANDFSDGLKLCECYGNDYYRQALHFWKSECFLRLGRKREALADLAQVRDGYMAWTFKLRTKSELLVECNKLPD